MSAKPKGVVTAHMKDGRTAFQFEDANDLRRVCHDRPGYKGEGGAIFEVKEWRWRPESGVFVCAGTTTLRYLDRRTISWVEQGSPL